MTVNVLLGVLCLSGWLILSECRQYHFVNQSLNWGDAVSYCRQNYTGLANIGNTEEMTQLIRTVSSAGYSSEVWIGVYFYLYGYAISQLNDDFWKLENQTANKLFLVYSWCQLWGGSVNGASWYPNCSVEYPFICYNGTSQNPQHVFVNVSMDWFRALRYCRQNYTELALDWASYSEFMKTVPNGIQAWIGYIAYPQISWSDGTDSSFRYWDDFGKIYGMFSSLYGVADLQRSGKWSLIPSYTRLPFVCYDERTAPGKAKAQKKVIKVRLKLEDSSVDLKDAAAKANLLKKLQARLKENGVDGVTVTWREQPDGAVFHREEKKVRKNRSCEL